MRTRLTRPTLAELWRVVLARLEDRGADRAPDLARSLAVSAFLGRAAEAHGVRVDGRGDEVLVVAIANDATPACPAANRSRAQARPPRCGCALTAL